MDARIKEIRDKVDPMTVGNWMIEDIQFLLDALEQAQEENEKLIIADRINWAMVNIKEEEIVELETKLQQSVERERVLREALGIAAKHIAQDAEYDVCPSDKGHKECYCKGTITDVHNCWLTLWDNLAKEALKQEEKP